jgi:hypothetical protein
MIFQIAWLNSTIGGGARIVLKEYANKGHRPISSQARF